MIERNDNYDCNLNDSNQRFRLWNETAHQEIFAIPSSERLHTAIELNQLIKNFHNSVLVTIKHGYSRVQSNYRLIYESQNMRVDFNEFEQKIGCSAPKWPCLVEPSIQLPPNTLDEVLSHKHRLYSRVRSIFENRWLFIFEILEHFSKLKGEISCNASQRLCLVNPRIQHLENTYPEDLSHKHRPWNRVRTSKSGKT